MICGIGYWSDIVLDEIKLILGKCNDLLVIFFLLVIILILVNFVIIFVLLSCSEGKYVYFIFEILKFGECFWYEVNEWKCWGFFVILVILFSKLGLGM